MIQNHLFGFFFFFLKKLFPAYNLFIFCSNVHLVITVFYISDFLAETFKVNKTSKKDHSFYKTVPLKKPHSFYELQLI